jgi:hypothetical protein
MKGVIPLIELMRESGLSDDRARESSFAPQGSTRESNMYRPETDPQQVHMTDVLCDFCGEPWAEDEPFVEGHRGAVICGSCLAKAYERLVLAEDATAGTAFRCRMCREDAEDRAALKRAGEPGWRSDTIVEGADLNEAYGDDGASGGAICRRCVKLAAGVLHKDPEFDWRKPQSD